MKKTEIVKKIKKQIEITGNVKELRLSPAWHDACSKLIKDEKFLFGYRVYRDIQVKFMQIIS